MGVFLCGFHKKFTNIFSKFDYFFPFWTFWPFSWRLRKGGVSFFTIFIYARTLQNGKFEHFSRLKQKKKEPIWRKMTPSAPSFWLFLFKSVNETRDVCRTDISAHNFVLVDQHICPNRAFVTIVIFDCKGVSRDIFASILCEIEPL